MEAYQDLISRIKNGFRNVLNKDINPMPAALLALQQSFPEHNFVKEDEKLAFQNFYSLQRQALEDGLRELVLEIMGENQKSLHQTWIDIYGDSLKAASTVPSDGDVPMSDATNELVESDTSSPNAVVSSSNPDHPPPFSSVSVPSLVSASHPAPPANAAALAAAAVKAHVCPILHLLDMCLVLSLTSLSSPIYLNLREASLPEDKRTAKKYFRILDSEAWARIVEEVVDVSDLDSAAAVFSYLKRRDRLLKQPEVLKEVKLVLLRTCNGLFKRLSKAYHVQLAGQLLIYLTRLFPLSDKAGLNVVASTASSLPMLKLEPPPEGGKDVRGEPVDAGLYTAIWNLQDVFTKPAEALTNTAAWNKFASDMGRLLDELKASKVAVAATNTVESFAEEEEEGEEKENGDENEGKEKGEEKGEEEGEEEGKEEDANEGKGGNEEKTLHPIIGPSNNDNDDIESDKNSSLNTNNATMLIKQTTEKSKKKTAVASSKGPSSSSSSTASAVHHPLGVKYLSNYRLLGLQIGDSTFRRHLLVQCLALLHHLSHPGKNEAKAFMSIC
eukprot:CAMPEP_0175039824 /NCGR_PEP_ID=MMETSP0052_2-20121109/859_1 /TAXON_ID=51329 ORGANISM="Polytomella parva, Strain SAG 63-3" /NCGR_SAMPLE_ID=MMETSP0052_2 /ASSEMBLY_ACC=CAM_ASM_000194 /LENGTH=555 /DNA_ID=CAMNT_0016301841 /DNA_START=35 /DNA_END=1699 /DNA_ORIENTATION=+